MKILAYVHAYVPHHNAGAETTLHDILRYLVTRGWECEVELSGWTGWTAGYVKPNPPKEPYTIDGVRVIPFNPDDRQRLNRVIADFDVLISHLESSERAAYVAEYAGTTPMVHLIHNTLWQTEGYLAMGCDLAIYNSLWVAAHHGVNRPTLVRIPQSPTEDHGPRVDFRIRKTSKWESCIVHPLIEPSDYRTTPGDCITLINPNLNKGPHIFYEMARRFPREKFLLVKGAYGDGEKNLQDVPNVEVIENTANVREDVYGRTRVLLMPSEYESFGRTAIEAAASGIPTIASPTEGLLEALGPSGTFADRDNLDEWEEKLAKLLNPKFWAVASRQAKRRSKYWSDQRALELSDLESSLKTVVNKFKIT